MHITGNPTQTGLHFKGYALAYVIESSRGNVGFRHGLIGVPALFAEISVVLFSIMCWQSGGRHGAE